jgi:hypothetical protein
VEILSKEIYQGEFYGHMAQPDVPVATDKNDLEPPNPAKTLTAPRSTSKRSHPYRQ